MTPTAPGGPRAAASVRAAASRLTRPTHEHASISYPGACPPSTPGAPAAASWPAWTDRVRYGVTRKGGGA